MHVCKWKVSVLFSCSNLFDTLLPFLFILLAVLFFRWRSADGNDYLCGYCQSQNEDGQTPDKPSSPVKFGPRGFGRSAKPETFWRRGLNTDRSVFRLCPSPALPSALKLFMLLNIIFPRRRLHKHIRVIQNNERNT